MKEQDQSNLTSLINQSDNPLIVYLRNNKEGRLINRWLHYFDIFHRHFAKFRHQPITMIEIGIFNGGSLRMWRDYFGPQAKIVGVDINPECAQFAEEGIDVVIGDQADRDFLRSLAAKYPDVAVLVDDGGHRMHQQITTLEELYPRLRPDGVYLCEDTHTSYMPVFGGGYRQPNTLIEVVKTLIDRLNATNSDDPQLVPDYFTKSTDSIHFYDSVVVIEKRLRELPTQIKSGRIVDVYYTGPSSTGDKVKE